MHIKMRALGFLFCFGLVLLPICAEQTLTNAASGHLSDQQATAVWDRYTVKDEEFSVLLPANPAMSSYEIRVSASGPSQIRHVIGAYSEGVGYAIYIYERKQSLDDFIANFRQSTGSEFKRELTSGGVHGKEYGFQNDTGKRVTDYFVTQRRIYVFEAMGSNLGNSDLNIPKFLESIRFFKNIDANVVVDGPGEQPISQPPSTADNKTDSIHTGREMTVKARIVSKPEPTYTQDARMNQITGTVVLRCVFRSSGVVTNITVVSGLEHGLTEKAIAAARQIKFIPPIKDGHFVSMYMQLEYNFNLY